MIFSDWMSLVRILIIGVGAYAGLILILRISGNRTLSKMNSFDFIVTIALGSTFASAILDRSVALLDALLAFTVLVGLQYLTTWASVRSARVDRLVKSEPKLLFWQGNFLRAEMKREHVTHDEILAAMREQGFSAMTQVGFVVLEPNGKLVAADREGASTLNPASKSAGQDRPSPVEKS